MESDGNFVIAHTLKIYFTELRRKLKVLRIKLKEKSLSV